MIGLQMEGKSVSSFCSLLCGWRVSHSVGDDSQFPTLSPRDMIAESLGMRLYVEIVVHDFLNCMLQVIAMHSILL